MSIIGELAKELGFFIAAFGAVAFTRRGGVSGDAKNPAVLNHEQVRLLNYGNTESDMQRVINTEFAPKRPAASLDDMMADIDDTDADLAEAIGRVERLIEQKRTQIAAMRTRLDAEDADIAARAATVAKMRTALRAEPAETAEKIQ